MILSNAVLPLPPLYAPGKIDIIRAIILRETRVRFGRKRLGYLWAILEPLLHIIALSAIFILFNRTSPVEEEMPVFFATGVLPWLLFTGIVGRTMSAMDANQGLLVYPHLVPVDFMVGRIVLESITYLLVAALLYVTAWFLDAAPAIDNPLLLIIAWGCLTLFAGGIGMVNAAIIMFVPSYETMYLAVQRILYFLSGIFFLMNDMPTDIRQMLAWNPVLHGIEWVRSTVLESYEGEYIEYGYFIACTLVIVTAGLTAERLFRREMRSG